MTWSPTTDGRNAALIGTPAGSSVTPEQAQRTALRVAQCRADLDDEQRRAAIRTVLEALGLIDAGGPVLDSDRRHHAWSPTRLSVVREEEMGA